ncbi:MAG: hypothetical protein KJS70_06725, partial [Actinomycetales bacterium]|nr:hypothetical protein [Actinomycetales bacterium]
MKANQFLRVLKVSLPILMAVIISITPVQGEEPFKPGGGGPPPGGGGPPPGGGAPAQPSGGGAPAQPSGGGAPAQPSGGGAPAQ